MKQNAKVLRQKFSDKCANENSTVTLGGPADIVTGSTNKRWWGENSKIGAQLQYPICGRSEISAIDQNKKSPFLKKYPHKNLFWRFLKI
jgi:hypothetical protein